MDIDNFNLYNITETFTEKHPTIVFCPHMLNQQIISRREWIERFL